MSLDYIRNHYGVPAKRGARITFTHPGPHRHGTITGARGQYLLVRFDGEKKSSILHPTWEVEYESTEKTADPSA